MGCSENNASWTEKLFSLQRHYKAGCETVVKIMFWLIFHYFHYSLTTGCGEKNYSHNIFVDFV